MQDNYFFNVGEADRLRLTILSKLYNPPALAFLQSSGLKPGMTVLEIGCGTGHMACDLAKYLGPSGKVIAIDSSADQIKIAKETAAAANIQNIDFHVCNVLDIAKLGIDYDATYGRWIIEFLPHPEQALELIYRYLRTGGILAYEAANMKQTAYFSYPNHSAIELWHTIGPKLFSSYEYHLQFGHEIFSVFNRLECGNIKLTTSQAILTNPEEKMVYRLGLFTSKNAAIEKNIMTNEEVDLLLNEFAIFEQSDAISGFFQNILISGIK